MDAWFIKKKWPASDQSAANANQAATLEKSQQEDECEPNPALLIKSKDQLIRLQVVLAKLLPV